MEGLKDKDEEEEEDEEEVREVEDEEGADTPKHVKNHETAQSI